MAAKDLNPSLDAATKTAKKGEPTASPAPVNGTTMNEERSFADATEQAQAAIAAIVARAQAAIQETLERLRGSGRDYVDTAGEHLDTAQKYVVERVKERPVTATLAGVGVGVLIGLLLAGRGKK